MSARRPDRMMEIIDEKKIWFVDMACPYEKNMKEKQCKKLIKYQQLAFEICERRPGYVVSSMLRPGSLAVKERNRKKIIYTSYYSLKNIFGSLY
jgi:hypothetical protein